MYNGNVGAACIPHPEPPQYLKQHADEKPELKAARVAKAKEQSHRARLVGTAVLSGSTQLRGPSSRAMPEQRWHMDVCGELVQRRFGP